MIHIYGPNNDKVMTIASYYRKINIQFHFIHDGIKHCVIQKLKRNYAIKEIQEIRKNLKSMTAKQIIEYFKNLKVVISSELNILLSMAEPTSIFVDVDSTSGLTRIDGYEVIELADTGEGSLVKKFKRGNRKKFKNKANIPAFAKCIQNDKFDPRTGRIHALSSWFTINGPYFI